MTAYATVQRAARRRDWRRDDSGVFTSFVAAIAIGLVAAAGLVYDGGQILGRYREASDLAAAAARAGAQAVDPAALENGNVRVDPTDARRRVAQFLANAGHPGAGEVTVDGSLVTVTVTLPSDGHFFPVATRDVSASSSARPVTGVEDARPGGAP